MSGRFSKRAAKLFARALSHPRWPIVLGGLAILLTLPSLWTGFILDDYLHRAVLLRLPGFDIDPLQMFSFVNGDPDRAGEPRLFALPWWAAEDLKLSFWRPAASLTHILDYALWPDALWLMHLHSVLWYAALAVVVGFLFRPFFEVKWQAGLAAFVYAASHTHAMPVFFLANRNALLSVFFGALALLLHHRRRKRGGASAAVLAPIALLLGLLSNEGAVAACGYLFAYALFIDTGTLRKRALSLAPYVVVVLVWRIFYQLHGYGAWASEAYIDPLASPVKFLNAVVLREPMYLFSQWFIAPTDFSRLVSSAALLKWRLFAVGFLVLLSIVLFPLLRRDAAARFWCAGMVLSLIPSCAVFPMDRMLLYSGIGGAALLTQLLVALYKRELFPPKARIRRFAGRLLFDAFVVLHIVFATYWLPLRIRVIGPTLAKVTDPIQAVAEKEELSRKLVVFVDDPSLISGYFPALRALAGLDPVAQVLVLAPVGSSEHPIVLSRPSRNTLIMEIDGDYEWFIARDRAHPFNVGDTVDLNRVAVEIQRIGDEGRPTQLAFHFDTALEDDSIAWFIALRPFTPPSIGRTETIQ